jgi:hypothetical protein
VCSTSDKTIKKQNVLLVLATEEKQFAAHNRTTMFLGGSGRKLNVADVTRGGRVVVGFVD